MILQKSMFNDYKQKPGYSIVSNLYLFFKQFYGQIGPRKKGADRLYKPLLKHELLHQGLTTSSGTSCPIRQADTGLISTMKRQRS